MGRSLTEAQVLKKLDIVDFRHQTKEKVMSMATMLDKMDPEVAKKALEQFPEFASTMRQILSEYKQSLDEGMKQNAEGVKSYYRILASDSFRMVYKFDFFASVRSGAVHLVIVWHERNLFCLPRQERFFHAFRGKIALHTGKYR